LKGIPMRVPAALARAKLPPPLLEVLGRLGEAGHRSWLVGGAVRDLLLHRPRDSKDFDVATPATPREVMSLFSKVVPTGVEHGTVTVVLGGHALEVTTFRGEGAYVDGRRPESVTFHTDLEADLERRDFTMNALAWDPLGREFRDPHGGRADMARRLVRAVGDPAVRFAEDGLRPMRAVRFAAQLGYELHPRTRAAIRPALPVVRKVAVERISDELGRLVVAPHADRALALMRRTGLLEAVLPALARLPGPAVVHAFAVARRVAPEAALRFAALLHPLAPEEAEKVLVDLRQPRRVSDEVAALLRAHLCHAGGRPAVLPSGEVEIRRFLSRTGPDRAGAIVALARAEAGALGPAASRRALAQTKRLEREIVAVQRSGAPLAAADLALDGRAVMRVLSAEPGPHVGEALRHLLDRVLENPALNAPDALEAELRSWWAARAPPL
jgi:tRNA nucleotidyltransferase (CCA-adding enzyme)